MSAATRLQAMDSLAAFLHERLVEDERREAAHSAVNRRARLAISAKRMLLNEWLREDMNGGAPAGLAFALRAISIEYSAHAEYRQEWKP